MPKAFRFSLALSLLTFLISAVSLILGDEIQSQIAWLYFLMPVLWCLWIWCAIRKEATHRLALIFLWATINFSILITLISLGGPDAGQSKGMDMTMLIAYFPVWFPILFLDGFFSTHIYSIEHLSGALGGCSTFIAWLEVSIWSAIQSAFIYIVARWVHLSRMHRHPSNQK
jgi:hypothetical protein